MHHLSEQEINRRENLKKLIELGIDPFPSETFEVNATAEEIKHNFNLLFPILFDI